MNDNERPAEKDWSLAQRLAAAEAENELLRAEVERWKRATTNAIAAADDDRNRKIELRAHLDDHHTALSALRRVHGLGDEVEWPKSAEEAYMAWEDAT